jgi:hypothetical protein
VCEQKVVSYLIASHHKFGMARNLSGASPEGVRSISAEALAKYQTTPARWRYACHVAPHLLVRRIETDRLCVEIDLAEMLLSLSLATRLTRNLPSAKGRTLPGLSPLYFASNASTAGPGSRQDDLGYDECEPDDFLASLRSIRVHVLQMLLGTP